MEEGAYPIEVRISAVIGATKVDSSVNLSRKVVR